MRQSQKRYQEIGEALQAAFEAEYGKISDSWPRDWLSKEEIFDEIVEWVAALKKKEVPDSQAAYHLEANLSELCDWRRTHSSTNDVAATVLLLDLVLDLLDSWGAEQQRREKVLASLGTAAAGH